MEGQNPDVKTFYDVLEKNEGFSLEGLNKSRPQASPGFIPLYSNWQGKGDKVQESKLPSISNVQQYLHDAMGTKNDGAIAEQMHVQDQTHLARSSWPRKVPAERSPGASRNPGPRAGSSVAMAAGTASLRTSWIATPPQRAWATPQFGSWAPGTAPTTQTDTDFLGTFDMDAAQRVMVRMKALEDFVRSKMGSSSIPTMESVDSLSRQVELLQDQVAGQDSRCPAAEAMVTSLTEAQALVQEELQAAREEARAARDEAKAARAAVSKAMTLVTSIQTSVSCNSTQLEQLAATQAPLANRVAGLEAGLKGVSAAVSQQAVQLAGASAASAGAQEAVVKLAASTAAQLQAADASLKADVDSRMSEVLSQVQSLQQQASQMGASVSDVGSLSTRLAAVESGQGAQSQAITVVEQAVEQAAAAFRSRSLQRDAEVSALAQGSASLGTKIDTLEAAVRQTEEALQGIHGKVEDAKSQGSASSDDVKAQIAQLQAAVARVDTLDQKVSADMQSTAERIDALEGRVAATAESMGKVDALDQKVSAAAQSMEKMDALDQKISAATETMGKVDALDQKISAAMQSLEKFDALEERVSAAVEKTGALDTAALATGEKLDALDLKVSAAAGQLDALNSAVASAVQSAEKVDALDGKVSAAVQSLERVDALDQKLLAAVEKVDALEVKVSAAEQSFDEKLSAASSKAPAEDSPTIVELGSKITALEEESKSRVSDLQQKISEVLQVLVQRVKTLEGTLNQQAEDKDKDVDKGFDAGSEVAVELVRQELKAVQASTASLLARVEGVEQESQKGLSDPLEAIKAQIRQQRLDTAEDVSELSGRVQRVELRLEEGSAKQATEGEAGAAAAPAALETRMGELHEDAMAALEEMKLRVTPVLQLLVKKVKAFEMALPDIVTSEGASGKLSLGGVAAGGSDSQVQLAEVHDFASDISLRLQEHEESTAKKLEALQSKISSVLQLLVARVKALEAKVSGGSERGSSPGTGAGFGLGATTMGLQSVPE